MSEKEIPQIGTPLSDGERLYHKFIDTFQDALEGCMRTGQECRLMIGMGNRNIVVHIHEAGKEARAFDDAIKEVAKGNFTVKDTHGNTLKDGIKISPTELDPT